MEDGTPEPGPPGSGQARASRGEGPRVEPLPTCGPRRAAHGRWPGYQRSDENVREEVCERLTFDHGLDATDVTVAVTNGDVQLWGEVEDPIDKRHAGAVAEDVRGAREVHNRLRARRGLIGGLVNRLTGKSEADKTGKGPSTRAPDTSRQ